MKNDPVDVNCYYVRKNKLHLKSADSKLTADQPSLLCLLTDSTSALRTIKPRSSTAVKGSI